MAMTGVWARPGEYKSHRSRRQAGCSFNPAAPVAVVCGSDGRTYINEEFLEYNNCVQGTGKTFL